MRQDAGVPFLTKQGYGPSSRDEETITGLFLNCDWTLGVTLEGEGYVEELPELRQGRQGTFLVSRRKVGFLSRRRSRKGTHLAWFFSSCGRKLGVPLKLRWGTQGPASVASGNSSLHVSWEGTLGIPLQLLPGLRSSSGDEAATSGFLSLADMDLEVPMEFPERSQASSRVEMCKFSFLPSCNGKVRFPVELTYGSVAFFPGATGLSHVPSCCESILGVTVESVQRNQVYLEWSVT